MRNESINILADITDAASIQAALGVITVRDLSVYPPFRAAKEILNRVFFPEQLESFDPESPADLIPKSGEFPTERVQYTSLVLDRILRPDDAPPLIDLAGPNFAPIDASQVAAADFGFNTLGLGMLLTLNQSWLQGVTLGHLLHSMALAAGESTRIAVIDWSRKTKRRTNRSARRDRRFESGDIEEPQHQRSHRGGRKRGAVRLLAYRKPVHDQTGRRLGRDIDWSVWRRRQRQHI